LVKKAFSIRHEPLGEQHPYESLPWERNPRFPTSGDTVILGVGTDRDHSADCVWCEWWNENIQIHQRVESVKCGSDEMYDYWQISLPAFAGGEAIRYCIFARSGDELIHSEEFGFTVMKWVDIESILCIKKTTSGSTAFLQTRRPDLQVRLDIDLSVSDKMNLRFSKLKTVIENDIRSNRTGASLIQGDKVKVHFSEEPFGIEIFYSSEQLSFKCEDLQLLVNQDDDIERYRFEFYSSSDEAFYGFGERFNALDQRGNRLINRVFAKYTRQGTRSYIPVPFFISSRAYGFWLHSDRWAEFDLDASKNERWILLCEAEEQDSALELTFFYHKDPLEIVRAFTDLTGKPVLPPPWTFGLWMSSNDWNSQAEVLQQLKLSKQHQILSTVLVIEAWSDEITFYIWNNAQYELKSSDQAYQFPDFRFPEDGYWPNPKEIIQEIHRAGSHLVLWQIPVLKFGNPAEHLDETQKKQDQEYAISQNYLIRRSDNTPLLIEEHMPWFPGSTLIDFSNPDAGRWWFEKHAYLLDEMDIDGFKTDGGEHIWDVNTVFYNGLKGKTGINCYPLWYESAYARFLETHKRATRGSLNDRVLFSRAGYTGIQKYSCHWTGDEESTWDAFRATIRAMLNVGLSGVSFIGWDIAGFAGDIPTSELYLRATAFSTFCPIMQFHSDSNAQRKPSRDRTPWNIEERTGDHTVIPTFRFFTNLRMNLLPYLISQAWQSSQTGIPLMRAFPLAFSENPQCREYPYQYMFGDALLVAPVVKEGEKEIEIYLPEGEWQDIWDRSIHQGPKALRINVPCDRIPVFQRKGSILPLNLGEGECLGSFVGNSTEEYKHLVLRIYPDRDGETPLYSGLDGSIQYVKYSVSSGEKKIKIDLPSIKMDLQIELVGIHATEIANNHGFLVQNNLDSKKQELNTWIYLSEKQSTYVKLSACCDFDQIWVRY